MSDDETTARRRAFELFDSPSMLGRPPRAPAGHQPAAPLPPAAAQPLNAAAAQPLNAAAAQPVNAAGRQPLIASEAQPLIAATGQPAVPLDASPVEVSGPGPFDPGRRGVRAMAAVAAVVVLVAAAWAWSSRPRTEPVVTSDPVAMTPQPGAVGDEPAPLNSATQGDIVVAVAGRVRRPGLVRLPPGARVADALQAAGGALPGVDVALLNLARRLVDGELILVGVTPPPGVAQPPGAPPAVPPPGGQDGTTMGKVNLNTATLAQLDALPGVGPVLAQRILDHRDQTGGFRAVSDLRQVDGIGESRYEDLKDRVTV